MKFTLKDFVILDESLKIIYKGSETQKKLRLKECIIPLKRIKRVNA